MAWFLPIAMALASYMSSRKAGGLQKAQEQNLAQQNQEVQYQQQRRREADPALNALLHLSMGMLPTYQQATPGLANWGGFGSGGGGGFGTAPNGNMFQTGTGGLPLGVPQGAYQTGPTGETIMRQQGPPTGRYSGRPN